MVSLNIQRIENKIGHIFVKMVHINHTKICNLIKSKVERVYMYERLNDGNKYSF